MGHIPRESVQQIQAFTDASGNFDVDLYIFILSYTRDRTQNILNAIGENQQLRGLLSSVIICDAPTGRYGKSHIISQVKDAFELQGKSVFVCDDSADVVEEVAYWIPREEREIVHIKLGRKRRAEEDCTTAKYFCDRGARDSFTNYLCPVKGKMASSDRSRSDRLEPLSGRIVSQMQAVSSPVPGG